MMGVEEFECFCYEEEFLDIVQDPGFAEFMTECNAARLKEIDDAEHDAVWNLQHGSHE
jgi:hypothetical protein